MTPILLGLGLGLGLVLIASPGLWPRGERTERTSPSTVRDLMTRAGLPDVPIIAVIGVAAILGLILGGLTLALVPIVGLAIVVGLLGFATPFLVLQWRARRRLRTQATMWPDVVDHLISGVRSGLGLPESVAQLADSGPMATRPAFRGFEADYRATGSFGYALDRWKSRLADPTGDRIAEILRMAREVGGTELTTVLVDLSTHLRTEQALRAEVEARQSWVLNAARLGVAAPWIVLLILGTRPEAVVAYNSPGGFAVLIGGAVVTIIAYRVMIAIGRLPQDGRWFA